ncbi:MAG: MASE3 domain-containing protein [Pseudomonadota bacterium]
MIQTFFIITVLVGLYCTTLINYLLFHSLAEIFSIVVACSFFMITWNSKKYIKNQYLLFIGIAYLFIAFLDLVHTLAYKGMPIFTDYDYYANQLWIGARYLESITLMVAFYFLGSNKSYKPETIFTIYSALTALIILSIFVWKVFPVCFEEGIGLTPFKKISEYIICTILLIGILLLNKNKQRFESNIYIFLLGSLVCTIISELAFTFYVSNYGFSNLTGHYFKLFSFYLIYKAIIETGIKQPYEVVFKELDSANKNLKDQINTRINIEKERERLIIKLQNALTEVKTLTGLIPICSHCKSIRNDEGAWTNLESYFQEHSDAKFSHGICKDCIKKYYPDLNIDTD